MTSTVGIYVHIPFCLQKCLYCDFCSFPGGKEEEKRAYVDALIYEIEHRETEVKNRAETVFFGGGTPTVLGAESLVRILDAIRRRFGLSPGAEVTLEANPATATEEDLRRLRQGGFNRLSMGVQSFSDGELALLGRAHTAGEAEEFFHAARRAGFDRINLDLMYGIPAQTEASWLATLQKAIALSPEHISAYGLILEERTPLCRMRDSLPFPDEDAEAQMYRLACEQLASAGYAHYEISNYAKKGEACRHNLRYWHSEVYYGFGLAAYSFNGRARYGNGNVLSEYLSAPLQGESEREELSPSDLAFEHIMLRLRMAKGVGKEEYLRKFGVDFAEYFREPLEKYLQSGHMKEKDGYYMLTEEGMQVSNTILVSFLGEAEKGNFSKKD